MHGIAAAQVVRRLDSSWVEAELASVLVLAVMVESIFFHGTYALPAIYGITAVYMGIAGSGQPAVYRCCRHFDLRFFHFSRIHELLNFSRSIFHFQLKSSKFEMKRKVHFSKKYKFSLLVRFIPRRTWIII